MKSEPREDQLNNAVVGPKLDTHLPEGNMVVMKIGIVLKPGNISPSKAHTTSPYLCHDMDTVSVGLRVFLFTAQGKSAFAQFKEVDHAFEKQHSILTGKVISNSKIQILITAKRGTVESSWVLIFWRCF